MTPRVITLKDGTNHTVLNNVDVINLIRDRMGDEIYQCIVDYMEDEKDQMCDNCMKIKNDD